MMSILNFEITQFVEFLQIICKILVTNPFSNENFITVVVLFKNIQFKRQTPLFLQKFVPQK